MESDNGSKSAELKQFIFDGLKGNDKPFYSARKIQNLLEYAEWRKFKNLIHKVRDSLNLDGENISYHIVHEDKMVTVGSGSKRPIEDILLSFHALKLLIQMADPRKEKVMEARRIIIEIEKEFLQKTPSENPIIQPQYIKNQIYTIRGKQVMMDRDLAELYGVKTTRLREQVQRNIQRFPEDFLFQLTDDEIDLKVSQNAIPSRKYLGGARPWVFTEQGIAGLSGVLKSRIADQVHVRIMRAFVEMRRIISDYANILMKIETLDKKVLMLESSTQKDITTILNKLQKRPALPDQGIIFNGQIFDAWTFISDLIRSAKISIIIIDNYVDDSVLKLLTKRAKNVNASIITHKVSSALTKDIEKHNAQYTPVNIRKHGDFHDRFIIIDRSELYHIGASLKDLGKKVFAFSRMNDLLPDLLAKL